MSESTPITQPPGPEGTPESGHETSDVNLPAIVWGGVAVLGIIVLTALVSWALLVFYNAQQRSEEQVLPVLVREFSGEDVGTRIRNVPSPRLEGLEMYPVRLSLRTPRGQVLMFSVGPTTRIEREGKQIGLLDLEEGTEASVVYRDRKGRALAIKVFSPATQVEAKEGQTVVSGTLVRIEPRNIELRRELARRQLERNSWVDRKKRTVRISVEVAQELILSDPNIRDKWLPARSPEENKR
jgi:hypothetical protein